MVLKVQSGSYLYLFTMPTIISRDISNTDIVNIIDEQKLAYK
jgi:hypothetical protein